MSDLRARALLAMYPHRNQVLTDDIVRAIMDEAFGTARPIDPAQFPAGGYGALTFQAEAFDAVLPELHLLHVAHWAETERARHGLALDPDYGAMQLSALQGELLQLTARCGLGALVGNIRLYLYRDRHTQTLGAKEDTFYLAPAARQGFAAVRFWQYAEACLTRLGVEEVRTDTKILHDERGDTVRNVGRLNEYLGYQHVSNGYLKTLKGKTNVQ